MPKNNYSKNGFTILEAIISLIVLVSLMSLGANYIKSSADKSLNQNSAAGLATITDAVKNYLQDNYAKIYHEVEGGLPHTILLLDTNNELTSNHYLSKNTPLINSYGQKYQVIISKEAEGLLRFVVLTTDGEKMEEGAMMQTSAILGGDAGYVSMHKSDQITGSQLAWQVPINNASVGHLATVNYLSEKDTVNANDFLRRSKTAGHDEWNTMRTDITMKENSIVFDDSDKTTSLINSTGVLFKDGALSAAQTAQALDFTSDITELVESKVTASYVKPGMIEFEVNETNKVKDVYQKADNLCDDETTENTNKIFSIKLKAKDNNKKYHGNIYSFICGKKDGHQLGSGRAYLTFFSGTELAPSINYPAMILNIATPCSSWDPVKDMGKDNCKGDNGPVDGRTNTQVRTLDFVKDIEAVNVWMSDWSGTGCRHKSPGSEHSAVCRAKDVYAYKTSNGSEPFYAYEFNQSIIDYMKQIDLSPTPHHDCIHSGIGGWSGDLQNIFVLFDHQGDNAIPYGSCDNLKYHD